MSTGMKWHKVSSSQRSQRPVKGTEAPSSCGELELGKCESFLVSQRHDGLGFLGHFISDTQQIDANCWYNKMVHVKLSGLSSTNHER